MMQRIVAAYTSTCIFMGSIAIYLSGFLTKVVIVVKKFVAFKAISKKIPHLLFWKFYENPLVTLATLFSHRQRTFVIVLTRCSIMLIN